MQKYVVYYRVSTKKQGESGLGLEAQERDVQLYLENYSDQPYDVVAVIKDVKSGKGGLSDRPALQEAVSLAEKQGAVLLVAKLDRLSRDVECVAHLIKRVEIKVACMPFADKFQLHLYAALAEQEREFISIRTKAALKAAKERGVKLGGLRENTKARNEALKQAATDRAEKLRAEFIEMKQVMGFTKLQQFADSLNRRSIHLPSGSEGRWSAMQVSRTLKRLSL